MANQELNGVTPEDGTAPERGSGTKLFLAVLGGFALLYGSAMAWHVTHPMTGTGTESPGFLERCRLICADYGLVATGDVSADANAYLEAVDSQKLSASLQDLLSTDNFERAVTEDHPLVGKQAPDFVLSDTQDQSQSLAELNRQGPVVLVFYYGYNCSHCVAQLFALQKDLEHFNELGAQLVAVSADLPAATRKKYEEYGGFEFPVLSDPDLKVAETWGTYVRETDEQQEDMLHGTFVIDRGGKVIFANRGYQPFVDNRSLLQWLNESGSATGSSDLAPAE